MLRRTIFGGTAVIAACALLSTAEGCGGNTGGAHGGGGDSGSEGGVKAAVPDSGGGGAPQDSSTIAVDDDAAMAQPPPPTDVEKVDILFDIDNSASMGDKQAYLAQAIPDLIHRLVSPNCVDSGGNATGVTADVNGNCSIGTAEFHPVHDMHIGIVSSSLGPRLGDACPTTGTLATQALAGGTAIDRHNDDQGHLLDRAGDPANLSNYTESTLAAAGSAHFLEWFPQVDANDGGVPSPGPSPITDPMQLDTNFQSLVIGVHAFGCGIESQLESWYRFLVQPDPYASLATVTINGNAEAQWVGVDTVLLAQRADFLRPDSLLAVIVLTDENDSEVDVRSFGGSAYHFMASAFNPPRGTSACAANPADPNCTSCAFAGHGNDPACAQGAYTSATDWGYDLNLRHVHEKQKYGADVQFPLQRYVLGLTSPKVPNRDGEYPASTVADSGTSPAGYQGLSAANLTCTNPLFAAQLPAPPAGVDPAQWQPTAAELCNLPPGPRNAGYVYYSHIGGVPHQLLQANPASPDSPQKATLTAADWKLILGNDPTNYDFSGIDPHMIESYQSRVGAVVPAGGFPVSATSAAEGSDPISGREFVTDSTNAEHQGLRVDREYACIFKLATLAIAATRPLKPIRRSSTRATASRPSLERARSPTTRCRPYATTRRRRGRTSRRPIRRFASFCWRSFSARCRGPTRGSSRRCAPSTPWKAKR